MERRNRGEYVREHTGREGRKEEENKVDKRKDEVMYLPHFLHPFIC